MPGVCRAAAVRARGRMSNALATIREHLGAYVRMRRQRKAFMQIRQTTIRMQAHARAQQQRRKFLQMRGSIV